MSIPTQFRGAEVAATLYSILETAKLAGIDPAAYLHAAALAAERGETLLPSQFVVASAPAVPQRVRLPHLF